VPSLPARTPRPSAQPSLRSPQRSAAPPLTHGGKPHDPAHQSDEQYRRPDNGTKRALIDRASGYTHRSFCPDAVRYMSVTTAMHRPTVTHSDTRRDKKETARRARFRS
jgi:hypothetical protein